MERKDKHMENGIFRTKSLDKISSPEQFNQYLCVVNTGVWLVLAAVFLLLSGVCIWGFFGRLETTLPVAAAVDGGSMVCYVLSEQAQEVEEGMKVEVSGVEYVVSKKSIRPEKVSDSFDPYLQYLGSFEEDSFVFVIHAEPVEAAAADGQYEAQIVVDSVSPMSFLWN